MYALIAKPLTRERQTVLQQEAAELGRYFTEETIADYPEVGLYRLKPHEHADRDKFESSRCKL